jgi:hypothetical protein
MPKAVLIGEGHFRGPRLALNGHAAALGRRRATLMLLAACNSISIFIKSGTMDGWTAALTGIASSSTSNEAFDHVVPSL